MPRMGAFITNLGSLQPVVEQKAQDKTEDWLEEHVIIPEGGAVTLDPTLTTANQAAEAKATGDAITAVVSSLNNQITELEEKMGIVRYGIQIDKNDSDPSTRITYLYDVVSCEFFFFYTFGRSALTGKFKLHFHHLLIPVYQCVSMAMVTYR